MADGTDSGSWTDWIEPEAAALGAAGLVASAVAHVVAGAPSAATAEDGGDGGADEAFEVLGDAAAGEAGTQTPEELLARQTQSVADHGVTLMVQDGYAQAQADMVESFNPSNY